MPFGIVERAPRWSRSERVDPIPLSAQRCDGFSLSLLLRMTKWRLLGPAICPAAAGPAKQTAVSNRHSWICCLALALIFAFTPAVFAVEDIPPPFGFHWNDSMTKLEQVLGGAKAKIVNREKKEKREVWTVEGLVQPGLRRTLFSFRDGFLVEVELQYEYPDWTIERYNERMGEIRRYFDAKFGTGKLVSRSRDTDSDVIQTLVGYQWIVGGTMLELFYFSAQRDKDLFRSITVSYKAI